ncbi:M56 family metallopeptidase [Myroides sp. M-43]|uniref:M56 family metallopeptidase n=1 Tax=Myroides oncorhynchi TaxID=2893756 RepID=UPI001E4F2B3E|nr:M56 family metallopeptidase [Myroides oncorhynchi]MCC9042464.1 M56 family metallopeptidase [Myroides oncorhynchi]
MLLYLTKITLILIASIGIYKLFLENSKAHYFKRYYLLGTLIIGLFLPFVTISTDVEIVSWNQTLEELNEVIIKSHKDEVIDNSTIDWSYGIVVVYLIGILFSLSKLAVETIKIKRLKRNGTIIDFNDVTILLSSQITNAFSFGNTVYFPTTEELSEENKILLHEIVHIQQRHSLDIILIEVLKSFFWFHPIFYYYKTCISLNHEFLADGLSVSSEEEVGAYLQLLLTQTYKQHELHVTSSFNFNLTKKRFIMITKTNRPWRNTVGISMSCILFLLVSTLAIHAKTTNQKVASDTASRPFQVTDTRAQYPGGMNKFVNDFVLKFTDPYPYSEEDEAKIVVQFTVEIDGSLENIKVLRDPLGVGEEIVKTLKSMPKWFPAQHNGEVVSTIFTLPITFKRTAP